MLIIGRTHWLNFLTTVEDTWMPENNFPSINGFFGHLCIFDSFSYSIKTFLKTFKNNFFYSKNFSPDNNGLRSELIKNIEK